MPPERRECHSCYHRTHDMDEAFCGHPESFKAGAFGLNFRAMRVENGPCGPEGKLYADQHEYTFE